MIKNTKSLRLGWFGQINTMQQWTSKARDTIGLQLVAMVSTQCTGVIRSTGEKLRTPNTRKELIKRKRIRE